MDRSGLLALLLDGEALRARIDALGAWGPAMVVGLMTLAILVSPIPSAPIAVAAGAAYGHTWGTLYVLIGAECGALAAFGLARWLGYEALHRWFGERISRGWLGSQGALTGFVLVTRLLPFVSFDLVSYAAGLSVLTFWRFAVATLVGTVPASFVLVHFGGEMVSGEGGRIMLAVIALGGLTLIPVLAAYWQRRRRASSARS
ncbi:MAG: TVP38/TMEM64 family protein [Thiohalorhabdaceae bacterium]